MKEITWKLIRSPQEMNLQTTVNTNEFSTHYSYMAPMKEITWKLIRS